MSLLGMLAGVSQSSSNGKNLKKAQIVVEKGNKKGQKMEVMFNPSQYSLSDKVDYGERKAAGKNHSFLNYKGGSATTLEMDLFFDTGAVRVYGEREARKATDVSKRVKRFSELTAIDSGLHAPPVVKFIWGSLSFRGYVTSVNSTYTCFTESGMPTQAKVHVSFMLAPDENDKKATPFESPDRTKCQMVREDYNIWNIAQNEYGDVSKWRVIAKANAIANPLEIPPGTILKVPAL